MARQPPLVRWGARLDQIEARLGLMSRAIDRWIAAGAEDPSKARLQAMRREIITISRSRGRIGCLLHALKKAGFEPSVRGHSTLVLAPGMVVAVRRERLGYYHSVWPGEPLDRLVVEKMIGRRPVVRSRHRRLGIIPKAHLTTTAA